MTEDVQKSMDEVIRQDGRYPMEAFAFLHDGLSYAVDDAYGGDNPGEDAGDTRHVTGPQLCGALRDLAKIRWGNLARTVLSKWNLTSTLDFGNMVYLLVDSGMMRKTEDDSLEDFREVFAFDEAFKTDVRFEMKE